MTERVRLVVLQGAVVRPAGELRVAAPGLVEAGLDLGPVVVPAPPPRRRGIE